MAQRKFELPSYDDLTKDQDDALALPRDGQHLIIGGPGTGKSILALLRCRRLERAGDPYVFLVFNHLLNEASRTLFSSELVSKTWQSWFGKRFYELCGELLPLENTGEKRPPIDWQALLTIVERTSLPEDHEKPYLVIDEGQDMPPQFYEALINLGFENFFVVADFNQKLERDKNSNRSEIEAVLGISPDDVIELDENFRNTRSIARLAREFYPGDPSSPPPELPGPDAFESRPLLYDYADQSFDQLISRILKMADRDPRRLIGLIGPTDRVRTRYLDALKQCNVELDNGPPAIRTYASGMSPELSFDQGGVVVINAQSCKGLEFDTVFLLDINRHYYRPDDAYHTRSRFYVMVARAIQQVILLRERGKHCPVEPLLPNDEKILERKP